MSHRISISMEIRFTNSNENDLETNREICFDYSVIFHVKVSFESDKIFDVGVNGATR